MFPITNTSSVEVRKVSNDFIVKENILKLYKKEVVVKNAIINNLLNLQSAQILNRILLLSLQEYLDSKLIFKEILEKEIGLKFIMKNLKMIMVKLEILVK